MSTSSASNRLGILHCLPVGTDGEMQPDREHLSHCSEPTGRARGRGALAGPPVSAWARRAVCSLAA